MIASDAEAEKNRLSTGTFSFSDLENEADYSSKSIGAEYHHYGNYDKMSEKEKNKVYNTIGLTPNISMPAKGEASSTTKSAVAQGTIDIRDNPTQDISALSRDTESSLNELGRIFDKQTIEEQQELAAAFGEEAFRLAHNLPDDGSGRKIAVHAIIGGIMSQITGAGFASGAVGAGLNEAVIKALDGKDPGTAQIVSAIIGAAAAKAINGNTIAGASASTNGTKWNKFSDFYAKVWRIFLPYTNPIEFAIKNATISDEGTINERMRLDMGDGDELHINTGHAFYRNHRSQRKGIVPSFRYSEKKNILLNVIYSALGHYAGGDLDNGEVYHGNEHIFMYDAKGKKVYVNLRIDLIKVGNIIYISDFYPTERIK